MSRMSRITRGLLLTTATAFTALLAVGCTSVPAAPENPISVGEYPEYYPSDYSSLVKDAEAEGGTLEIYSNIDEENWTPIFRDFKKKYPFVTTINASNLDSDEIFQRVLSEEATNGSPADIIVSGAAQGWAEFAAADDTVTEYASPETAELPDFAELLPSVYAFSTDPMGIVYNTSIITDEITGYQSLADAVKVGGFTVGARDVASSFGFSVSYALTKGNPDVWGALETLLSDARPETSSGTQSDKVLSGEYSSAFVFSAAPAYPLEERSGGLARFVLPDDGTVVVPRGIGVGPSAPHSSTAKLFLDFVLSEEGQAAVAEGGLTSYRASVKATDGLHTYQEVVDTVGEENVFMVPYQVVPEAEITAFTKRWNSLFG